VLAVCCVTEKGSCKSLKKELPLKVHALTDHIVNDFLLHSRPIEVALSPQNALMSSHAMHSLCGKPKFKVSFNSQGKKLNQRPSHRKQVSINPS
jgi:hypothetical protein